MTLEDIITLARAAGFEIGSVTGSIYAPAPCQPELERFARLVAAAEREACALLVEKKAATNWVEMAAAIRKRGKLLA
jgi:hypothetical protein